MFNCKKRLLGSVLLVASLALAGAPISKAEEPFKMDGTSFSGCKAAEPYALQKDGSYKPEYMQRCGTNKRREEKVAVRRAPICDKGTWSAERGKCINIKPDF